MFNLNIFVYISIALVLGLLSSKVMEKIKFPNVTGYIVIGLIAGPYLLNLIPLETVENLSIIKDIALGLIAFSIGSEFKVSFLKVVGKSPIIIAFFEAMVAVILLDIVLILMGNDVAFSIVLGAIAAATAPAATLMVVRQYQAKGPVTSTLLPVVALDDAVALMCFGISVAIAKSLNANADTSMLFVLLKPILEIGGSLLLGALLGVILKFFISWFSGDGSRLTVSLTFVFICSGVALVLGLSQLLVCMAMGAVFTNISKFSEETFKIVDGITHPIYLLFFFLSGAELDITILPSVGLIGVVYIVVRVVGKVIGAAIGAEISKAEPVVKKYLGYTLIPQAGVAIGLAGLSKTVVPEYGYKIQTIILCATVIYELVGPLVTKIALTKAGEIKNA